jgi:hypothetical protein
LGVLLSAGHTLDDILDMTWAQIHLSAESILLHKTEALNMVLEPVITILGGKFKKSKITKNNQGKNNRNTKMTPAQKEQMLIHQFRAVGVPVIDT